MRPPVPVPPPLFFFDDVCPAYLLPLKVLRKFRHKDIETSYISYEIRICTIVFVLLRKGWGRKGTEKDLNLHVFCLGASSSVREPPGPPVELLLPTEKDSLFLGFRQLQHPSCKIFGDK